MRFHIWLQWLADRQLAAAAEGAGLAIGLYRDLAVGTAPDGAEAWAGARQLAAGVSVGAPPDPFSAQGQIWHLPPFDPWRLRADGYRGLAGVLGANMRHAGALRIDHAMGLARLFWVPDGASGADGAYVAYPRDDLLGELALESQRARCLIVGEDLGTVPEGFREALAAAEVFSYRVLWFEREGMGFRPPARYPAQAVACVSTHDLPTLAGWRAGADITERAALGQIDAAAARTQRTAEIAALTQAIGAPPDAPAVHGFLAEVALRAGAGAGRRPRGRARRAQPARHRPRAAELAAQARAAGAGAAGDAGGARGAGPAAGRPDRLGAAVTVRYDPAPHLDATHGAVRCRSPGEP